MVSLGPGSVLVTLFVVLSIAYQGQGVTVTRKIAPPVCTVNFNTRKLTSKFVAKMNTDQINYIAGCRLNQTTNAYQFETCTFTQLVDNGETYYVIETIIDLDDPSDAATTNPCGFMTVSNVDGTLDYKFRVAFRQFQYYFVAGDYDYQWTCKRSTAMNTYLTVKYEAIFDQLLDVDVVNPSVTFTVVNTDGSDSSSCKIAEKRKLKVTMTNLATYEDQLTPYGLYIWDLIVGRTLSNVQGKVMTNTLVGANGCSTGNPLSLTSGFVYSPADSNTQQAVYFTGEFTCRRYMNTDMLYFATTIGTCRGPRTNLALVQDKCYSYCAHSNARKKRDSEFDAANLYTTLTIEDESFTTEEQESSNTMLIVVAVCVSVVVMALLVVFACFMFYMSKKQRRNEKRGYPADSSRASSDRQLPIKF